VGIPPGLRSGSIACDLPTGLEFVVVRVRAFGARLPAKQTLWRRLAIVAQTHRSGYEPAVGRPTRFHCLLLAAVILTGPLACQTFPPAMTGITIYPSDADGLPTGEDMYRTRRQPPIPLIGVRPGADPSQSAPFLNEPTSGEIAVTLARGVQNFLLYSPLVEPADHFVIAIYLDHEPQPSLSGVVDGDLSHPVVVSRAAVVWGLDGEPVPNHSAGSVVRDGYRVSLRRAAFPLTGFSVDTIEPWRLRPDNIADSVGVITVEVQPVT
jgi:hypothetical protein